MALPKKEGVLTDEQREVLKIAAQNAHNAHSLDVLSSSAKSPKYLHSEHPIKAACGGKAAGAEDGAWHVRRSHSGKFVRAKKDGGGGKGTWGKLLDTGSDAHLDRNDPNYEW